MIDANLPVFLRIQMTHCTVPKHIFLNQQQNVLINATISSTLCFTNEYPTDVHVEKFI